MGAAKTTETVKQITHLAGALKAPRITEAASRLADQARDAGWSFEDYLAAVLEREVSARNASGAELRIRAAGFPARKTLEDFDWDTQPATRQQIAALGPSGLTWSSVGSLRAMNGVRRIAGRCRRQSRNAQRIDDLRMLLSAMLRR